MIPFFEFESEISTHGLQNGQRARRGRPAPGYLAEAAQAEEARRAEVDVGLTTRAGRLGQRLAPARLLRRGHLLQARVGRGETLLVQVRDHVLLFRGAAVAREGAAERESPAG